MNALRVGHALRINGNALRFAIPGPVCQGRRALHVSALKGNEEHAAGKGTEHKEHKETKHAVSKKEKENVQQHEATVAPYEAISADFALPPSLRQFNNTLTQMQRQMDTMMNQFLGEDMMRPLGSFSSFLMPGAMMPRGLGLLDLPAEEYAPTETGSALMAMDVQETDNAYIMSADVPGFSKDEVKVFLTPDSVLTLKGEHKQVEEKQQEGRYLSKTRRFTSFNRSFRLPKDACTDGINAAVKDGVLTVTVPKVVKEELPHKDIPIM